MFTVHRECSPRPTTLWIKFALRLSRGGSRRAMRTAAARHCTPASATVHAGGVLTSV